MDGWMDVSTHYMIMTMTRNIHLLRFTTDLYLPLWQKRRVVDRKYIMKSQCKREIVFVYYDCCYYKRACLKIVSRRWHSK
jgi:hypothetical protein